MVITYKRDGKEQKVNVTLGKSKGMSLGSYNYNFKMPKMDMITPETPYAFSMNNGKPRIGIKAQDTEDGKGVKVLDIDDESPADKAGIKEGDIITQFDDKDVNSTETLVNLARNSKTKPSVKVKINRDGKTSEVEIKTPKKLKTTNL